MKRMALVGGGIGGVALAWHLLECGFSVSLFDPNGIAGGASGVATGLLHPFPGKRAHLPPDAEEGIEATFKLIQVAEERLKRPCAERSGVFRPAITASQRQDFTERAEQFPSQTLWCEKPPFGQGLWIGCGLAVFTRLFLEGLWSACEKRGAELHLFKVSSLQELQKFDGVILATGAETLEFAECQGLPLKAVKGQSLVCRWPEKIPFSLASLGHITPMEDPSLCQVGSTYEHFYSSLDPDPRAALPLLEKVALFYPPARDFTVLEIRAGRRMARVGSYLPLVQQIGEKAWVFSGLGSKGLLYGPLYAQRLAEALK